jgi:hypothetical protein
MEEESAYMVTVWGRNIRANLYPVGKAGLRPPPFTLPATEVALLSEGKMAVSQAFSRFANIITKNTLPLASFRVKHPVIFFTNP